MASSQPIDALDILAEAREQISDRAATRDDEQKAERSMAATVAAFNGLYGTDLTETQGWMFMVFLKAARARNGVFNVDDYVDGAAYFALAGECASPKLDPQYKERVLEELWEEQQIRNALNKGIMAP